MRHKAEFLTANVAERTMLYKDAPHVNIRKRNVVPEKTKCIFYNNTTNKCNLFNKKRGGKKLKYCLNYKMKSDN